MMAFERHRDKNGQITGKHGNTVISTLGKHYGHDFADKLGDVLQKLDEPSLSKLVHDEESGEV